jgi:benzoyl-CoA 2,3-dioxygenase component B
VDRWNAVLNRAGIDFAIKLPSRRFHRQVGIYSGRDYTPDGAPVTHEEWERRCEEWLPSQSDLDYVASLMHPVHERGKIAGWVAAPSKGIHGKPFDFDYVRL